MFWDISIVYMLSGKAGNAIRYNSNTSELQVIKLLESHVRMIKGRINNYYFIKFACLNY